MITRFVFNPEIWTVNEYRKTVHIVYDELFNLHETYEREIQAFKNANNFSDSHILSALQEKKMKLGELIEGFNVAARQIELKDFEKHLKKGNRALSKFDYYIANPHFPKDNIKLTVLFTKTNALIMYLFDYSVNMWNSTSLIPSENQIKPLWMRKENQDDTPQFNMGFADKFINAPIYALTHHFQKMLITFSKKIIYTKSNKLLRITRNEISEALTLLDKELQTPNLGEEIKKEFLSDKKMLHDYSEKIEQAHIQVEKIMLPNSPPPQK
ncbi:MAG: hypothetical protein ACD_44C00225G0002 [uncultured bacterium]|nr:MAG: hypothetical protein ACD_44C00225G0002 [uncultured bacterium]OGT16062.1 MAG: hypothetical protein A3B69_00505 [Gammaproteobacteria bacterium RIFCSPHIGHO2_02_FULL_38_33]OGT24628.1 MAG: hypothetical protein A2W47_06080 [Gammaproteobacteria bacterium RIFCSPHIGHO2_12_38_15]OGT67433.1 MAG: hypothetical protein A3I12_04040 [Gammaproteobacteria bacterium RIFCSPLOWO2_02_FULL_38_11]OGT77769.1 MAG: hypothetical protein A3G71_05980 [Gammaproteobacteria bacterium RIFCSPLOWO2_12_FULL_38_14]